MITGALPTPDPKQSGNGPPRDGAVVSEILSNILAQPRPISPPLVLRARGKDVGTYCFRVLTNSELSSAIAEAHRLTRTQLGDSERTTLAYEQLFEENKGVQVVFLSMMQPGDPKFRVFQTAASVREELTDDEIGPVLAAYTAFRRSCGPVITELTPEEMDAWIDALAEAGSSLPLASFSTGATTDLVMYLVSRLRAAGSLTGSSSGGPPAGGPSSPTPTGSGNEPSPE